MPAADHGKRIGAGKIRCALDLADGFFPGIDQIAVLLAFDRIRADAEHSILRLENHIHARRDVVRDQRWQPDAEIHVKAVLQFASDTPHDAFAFVEIFHKGSRWSLVVGRQSSVILKFRSFEQFID